MREFSYEVRKNRSLGPGRPVSLKTEVKLYLLFLRNSTEANGAGEEGLTSKLLVGFRHCRS